MSIFSGSVNRLEAAIRAATVEQQSIAKNIANLDNPNYVPSSFDSELRAAQGRIDRKMLLENEMAKLGENSIKVNSLSRILTQKYQGLNKIATLGK